MIFERGACISVCISSLICEHQSFCTLTNNRCFLLTPPHQQSSSNNNNNNSSNGSNGDDWPVFSFDSSTIRYDFAQNSDYASRSSSNNTGMALWAGAAAGGGALLLLILFLVFRRKKTKYADNTGFILKDTPASRKATAREWVNPMTRKAKRGVAYDCPVYDHLDSYAWYSEVVVLFYFLFYFFVFFQIIA